MCISFIEVDDLEGMMLLERGNTAYIPDSDLSRIPTVHINLIQSAETYVPVRSESA